MRFGVADYGMSVWDGGRFDIEERLRQVRAIGYEGLERVEATSADDAINNAARFRRMGMDFATCRGPDIEHSIRWTAALGKDYVWTQVTGKTFDVFCRQVALQCEVCKRWGIRATLHNHLGTLVETQAQLVDFLEKCPDCGLLLDTAHLAAAGGDPIEIVRRYAGRLTAVHLKDYLLLKPDVGFDKWYERGRFCELGAGNIGLDNAAVMKALVDAGYDGWIFVEQDSHLQEPIVDLEKSRAYLKDAGF